MRAPEGEALRWQVSSDVEALAWAPHAPTHFLVSSEDGIVACFDARQVGLVLVCSFFRRRLLLALLYFPSPNNLSGAAHPCIVLLSPHHSLPPTPPHLLGSLFPFLCTGPGVGAAVAAGCTREGDLRSQLLPLCARPADDGIHRQEGKRDSAFSND